MQGDANQEQGELLSPAMLAKQKLTAEQYLPLVRQIAAMLYARRTRDDVAYEEYYQHGVVGLLEAMNRYDPSRNAAFETYATFRIRGAILTGLAHETEKRAHNEYLRRLQHERLASDETEGEQSEQGFKYLMKLTVRLALGYILEKDRDDSVLLDKTRFDSAEFSVLCRQVHGLVNELPERERIVIHDHYFMQSSFEQISKRLGVTKGRVSQLHRAALDTIQSSLKCDSLNDKF